MDNIVKRIKEMKKVYDSTQEILSSILRIENNNVPFSKEASDIYFHLGVLLVKIENEIYALEKEIEK